jgi:general secretion pathway protein G
VIPQFTGASTEAKESSLVSDLQTIRSQIELYKIQHNDMIPGEILASGTVTPVADAAGVVNALCNKTDQYGNVDNTNGKFGPYMKKFPVNPFSNLTATDITVVADLSEGDSSLTIDGSTTTADGTVAAWNFVTAAGVDKGHFQAYDGMSNSVTAEAHVDY